jgi:hypothetical protein
MQTFASAVDAMTSALRPYELRLDIDELVARFGIPIKAGEKPPEQVEMDTSPDAPGGFGVKKPRMPTSPPSGESKEKGPQAPKAPKPGASGAIAA